MYVLCSCEDLSTPGYSVCPAQYKLIHAVASSAFNISTKEFMFSCLFVGGITQKVLNQCHLTAFFFSLFFDYKTWTDV